VVEQVNEAGSAIGFYFLNPAIGWVAIDSVISKTTDGGASGNTFDDSRFRFTSLLFGRPYRLGSGRTQPAPLHDGGARWQSIPYDSGGSFVFLRELQKIVFANDTAGWLIGYGVGPNYLAGQLFATTDGGNHWRKQLEVGGSFGPYLTFSDIEFKDGLLGWAIFPRGTFRTTNGGANWNSAGGAIYIRVASVLNDSTLIGAGILGVLYSSTDSASSWQKRFVGFVDDLDDLMILDSNTVLAGGGKTTYARLTAVRPGRKLMLQIFRTGTSQSTHLYSLTL